MSATPTAMERPTVITWELVEEPGAAGNLRVCGRWLSVLGVSGQDGGRHLCASGITEPQGPVDELSTLKPGSPELCVVGKGVGVETVSG